ncbi:Protein CBG26590 [Caenorhabditis briggsae]|uniref:Protein CBG26590 n=1 Tax=Caenorhabditis briggsae TaxID=6238 RepID=B6IIF0_CAEBR|nr:Protein CBG26590 [Caenorhabditis briggsae]CAR99680.1 Protein CBG26590 [Caenorhabditis briggsae]
MNWGIGFCNKIEFLLSPGGGVGGAPDFLFTIRFYEKFGTEYNPK